MNESFETAKKVVETLREKGLFITAMESCTGGGLANCITNVSGASDVMLGARIAYSSEEKIAMGIPKELTRDGTVYSEKTAVAMAQAGMETAVRADLAVGITGHLSFPDPDQKNRAYIAVVWGHKTRCVTVSFPAECERWKAKEAVIEKALQLVSEMVDETP